MSSYHGYVEWRSKTRDKFYRIFKYLVVCTMLTVFAMILFIFMVIGVFVGAQVHGGG
jgi:hypothetical protein